MSYRVETEGGGALAGLEPTLRGIALVVTRLALALAALSGAWLLYGIVAGGLGQFEQLAAPAREQVAGAVRAASSALGVSLAIGSLGAVFLHWREGAIGYLTLAGAALIGLGVPFGIQMLPGGMSGRGIALAAAAFPAAAWIPALAGTAHAMKDTALWCLTLGARLGSAAPGQRVRDDRPLRLSPLGKCWEGPACRENLRPHCPVFQARKACWKQRRGCYCEEEIIAGIGQRVQGILLEMAPSPQYNFAQPATATGKKPALTERQKRERCRHCIVYNEHQREKYRLLLPAVLVLGTGLCLELSLWVRPHLGLLLGGADAVLARISFTPAPGISHAASPVGASSPGAEIALLAAASLILVAKIIQLFEWAVLVKKL